MYLAVCQEGSGPDVRLLAGRIQNFTIDAQGAREPHAPYGWSSGWQIQGLAALARDVPVALHIEGTNDRRGFHDADAGRAHRITTLAHRLILGVLLELMDPKGDGTPAPSGPSSSGARGRRDGVPAVWTFELRREVKIDARPYVAAYLGGQRNAPAMQWMVRGHARRQVCGKGRLGRKTIWVEPYWKGGADLPIAVRTHRLADPPADEKGSRS